MIINDLDGYYIVFDTKNWNTERFFSNFSTKPHILYEGAIFLRKFNIKN